MTIKNIIFDIIITALYIITLRYAILFISGYNTIIDVCDYYKLDTTSFIFSIFNIILIPVLGYIYVKTIGMGNLGLGAFCFLFSYLSFIYIVHASHNTLEERLYTKPSKVIQGIIINKNSIKAIKKITYKVLQKNQNQKVGSDEWFDLKIGDTILIKIDLDCNYVNSIYSLTPTKKELKESEKGCYLIDGELLENDKKTIISIAKPIKKTQPGFIGYVFVLIIGLATLFIIFAAVFEMYGKRIYLDNEDL